MAIQKRFIHFKKFEDFNKKKLSANEANTQYTVGVSGVIQDGEPDVLYSSYCWIKDTKQQWTHGQLYDGSVSQAQLNHTINSRVFVGTRTEYDIAYAAGSVGTGALVIILDENEMETSTVTALLGTAVLGKMLLGTN
jgi:hypothetical protein